MEQFLLWSLIASIAGTLFFNLLLLIKPDLFRPLEQSIRPSSEDAMRIRLISPVRAGMIGLVFVVMLLNFGVVLAA